MRVGSGVAKVTLEGFGVGESSVALAAVVIVNLVDGATVVDYFDQIALGHLAEILRRARIALDTTDSKEHEDQRARAVVRHDLGGRVTERGFLGLFSGTAAR